MRPHGQRRVYCNGIMRVRSSVGLLSVLVFGCSGDPGSGPIDAGGGAVDASGQVIDARSEDTDGGGETDAATQLDAALRDAAGPDAIPTSALTVTAATGGTVICGAVCPTRVVTGSEVTIKAMADDGYRFTGWTGTGACDGAAEVALTFTVGEDTTCTAGFVRRVTVAWTMSGATGTITASAADPLAACDASSCTVDAGTVVSLTAPAVSGLGYGGWSGGCTGIAFATLVTPVADTTCTARYHGLWAEAFRVTNAGNATLAMDDGSAVLVGDRGGVAPAWIAHLDGDTGAVLGEKSFERWDISTFGSVYFIDAVRSTDQGYAVLAEVGTTFSIHPGVFRFDDEGVLTAETEYFYYSDRTTFDDQFPTRIARLADGGFAVLGLVRLLDNSLMTHVMALDSGLGPRWAQAFCAAGSDCTGGCDTQDPRAVFEHPDGSILVVSASNVLTLFDADGVVLWSKSYGAASAFDVTISAESGGFLLAGSYTDSGNMEGLLLDIDKLGEVQSARTIGGTEGNDSFRRVIAAPGGGYRLVGTVATSARASDFWLVGWSDTVTTQVAFGLSNNEVGRALVAMPSGGTFLSGWSQSFGNGGGGDLDAWALRVEGEGLLTFGTTTPQATRQVTAHTPKDVTIVGVDQCVRTRDATVDAFGQIGNVVVTTVTSTVISQTP
jgi:hypothetical protein